jgi:hypothetical protein
MCLRDWLNIRVDDEEMDEEVWDSNRSSSLNTKIK